MLLFDNVTLLFSEFIWVKQKICLLVKQHKFHLSNNNYVIKPIIMCVCNNIH
jgi:hypothetical protein